MQSIKNIYEKIYDFENLHKAWEEARKGKRYRDDVLIFNRNYEEQLINIQNHLIYETYEVGKYHTFYVYEPKKRLIVSLPFKDRIVQWAIYRQLFPLYEKTFIFDSYACRKGKGTHKAADRLQYWLRQTERKPERYYYLKMDISKYFYRVDHDILLKILARRIKDQRLLNLLEKIINCESMNFGLPPGKEPDEVAVSDRLSNKGMPIGNLTSQMFANIYLNEVDQYAKHELGLHYYIRYMDDIIILHHDKKYLAEVKELLRAFLSDELRLDLNNKTTIFYSPLIKLSEGQTMFMTNHILNGQLSECYNFIHSRIYKNSIPQPFKRPTWLFLTIYRNNQPGFSIMVVKDSFSLGMVTIL